MRKIALLTAMLFAFAATAHAEMPRNVTGFAESASLANGYAIRSSELMLKHTSNRFVTDYAQRMLDEHKAAQTKLEQALDTTANNRMFLPKSLDASYNEMIHALIAAPYVTLDKTYVRQQLDFQRDQMDMYENYARGGDNMLLRNYAMDMTTVLRARVDQLNSIGNMGNGMSNTMPARNY